MAAEAAARAQDPRESRLGRRRAACPVPVIYCPGAKGPRRGPRSIVHSVLQVMGLELAARTVHRPVGGHPLPFHLPFLRQLETRYRWPAWPRLGPACRSPYLQLISESLGPAMRLWAEAAGNETPDAYLAPARICFGRTRRRGRRPGTGETGTRRPASHPTRPSHSALLTGPAGQASGQHCRGPDRIAAHRVAEPGPGQRRPSGQLDVSSRQACGSRPPPP